MIHIYYMKFPSDCSEGQSLALLYGEKKSIVITGNRDELYGILPRERKEAVDRAKNENVARKRLYTGAFLQYVLSAETGLPMERLQYEYNEWGKPVLACSNLHFNLSHSGEYVVIAVSDAPVGIDVEHKTRGYEALSQRCFCKEEYEDIMSLNNEDMRKQRFLKYWTMKEAYIKCVGEGMRIPLNSFLIRKGSGDVFRIDRSAYCLATTFIEKNVCMAVCSDRRDDVVMSIQKRES